MLLRYSLMGVAHIVRVCQQRVVLLNSDEFSILLLDHFVSINQLINRL